MNRNTAKQGIISPQDIREYRKEHPVRIKVGDHNTYPVTAGVDGGSAATGGTLHRRGPLPSDANPNFAYGKPTRPSTPVATLMTDQYQREWMEEQGRSNTERTRLEKEKHRKKHTKEIKPRRRHTTQKIGPSPLDLPLPDPATLFKMSKFEKKAKPVISSRRPADDPALTGCEPSPAPVFRVVRDRWLGQQPRIWEHGPPAGAQTIHPAEATHTTVTMKPEKAKGMGPVHIAAATAAEPLLYDCPARDGHRNQKEDSYGPKGIYLSERNPVLANGSTYTSERVSYEPTKQYAAPTKEVRFAPEIYSSSSPVRTSISTVATSVPQVGAPRQDPTFNAPPTKLHTTVTAVAESNPRAMGATTAQWPTTSTFASKAMPEVTHAGLTAPADARCANLSNLASLNRAPEASGLGSMVQSRPMLSV
ncbi:hypothetical protein HK104_005698 [Borealophlyctis nickersoniae]|nr:hypothetical protein HK104_005698 [Borealophlyctis nickersoniae]